jgi:hypothetical protein
MRVAHVVKTVVCVSLALFGCCLHGADAAGAAKDHALTIRPIEKDKWGCELEDVRRVLVSAASETWPYFPERKLPVIEVSPKGGPIVLFKRGPNGEIQVRLDSGKLLWAQIAFQFAHEFCHIMCSYKEGDKRNKWFEESVCETASLFALRRMAETWQTKPPYPKWKDYVPSLNKYADTRIKEAALPEGKTLAQWYKENADALAKEPTDRPRNNVVAGVLLKHFEATPDNWAAIEFLNAEPLTKDQTFKDYLTAWQKHCPEKRKSFVAELAKEFDIELAQ